MGKIIFKTLVILFISSISLMFCLHSYAIDKNNSWKEIFPTRTEGDIPSSILRQYKEASDRIIKDMKKDCPIEINEFTKLVDIYFQKDNLNVYVDYSGPLPFFFFEYNDKTGQFDYSKELSRVETLRRIMTLISSDNIDKDISSYIVFYVETGTPVEIVILNNDNLDKDAPNGFKIILKPNGEITEPEFVEIVTQITILDDPRLPLEKEEEEHSDLYKSIFDSNDATKERVRINNDNGEDEIFSAVEISAEFPGGQSALMDWLRNNVRYPQNAYEHDIQGRVIVKFVIEKDGSVSNVKIAKGVDKDLDMEAIRVASKLPKWKPGYNNGVPVRSWFTLPITFKLQERRES